MLRFSPARGGAAIVLNSNVRGPQGAAATLSIGTTTTKAAGADATASNSGTSGAAILNLGIPRGADAGLMFNFEASTTMAAPASGGIRFSSATISSVTGIAINAADAGGIDVSDFAATFDDSTGPVKGYMIARKEGSGAVLGIYQITSVTDNTTWLQFAVTYVSGSGTFAADDHVYLVPLRVGNKGTSGGVSFLFASSTSMADPSSGNFRLNNAALASVTAAAVSANSGDSGNPSVIAWLRAFDDSTTTAHRGYAIFRKETAPENFAIYDITGALTDNTTWVQLVLTHVSSSGSFSAADSVVLSFSRTGDKGTDGVIGGSTGAIDNALLRADGPGGATVQSSAVVVDDSGNVSGVATLTTTGNIELGNASDTTVSRSAAGIVAVEGVPLYSQIPQNSKSAAYTTVLSDAQKHIYHPSSDNNARTFTIDSNANVAYPIGTTIMFVNEINTVTIAITSDTMTLAGTGTTGSRTLAANGLATALKVATTKWVISGAGLT